MSNLSDSLTVAHFLWATWVICLRSLICLERSERIAHSRSIDLSKMSKWANEWIPSPAVSFAHYLYILFLLSTVFDFIMFLPSYPVFFPYSCCFPSFPVYRNFLSCFFPHILFIRVECGIFVWSVGTGQLTKDQVWHNLCMSIVLKAKMKEKYEEIFLRFLFQNSQMPFFGGQPIFFLQF